MADLLLLVHIPLGADVTITTEQADAIAQDICRRAKLVHPSDEATLRSLRQQALTAKGGNGLASAPPFAAMVTAWVRDA